MSPFREVPSNPVRIVGTVGPSWSRGRCLAQLWKKNSASVVPPSMRGSRLGVWGGVPTRRWEGERKGRKVAAICLGPKIDSEVVDYGGRPSGSRPGARRC